MKTPAVVNFAPEAGSVEVREFEKPSIGATDVLVQVAAVGVCGSDLHQWTASHSWPVNYPVVLGHEFAGTIVERGSEVKNWKEGDRIASETAAIIDPDGPGGQPLGLFESGAILVYLAEKTGRFLPTDPAARYETLQWVFFQMAAIGPMFGQLGFFHRFAGKDYEDKRPRDRYAAESKRLLGVLEERLASRTWIMGDDYTIADIATLGWVRNLVGFYEAGDLVDYGALKHVPRWLEAGLARPAVQRGVNSPARP